MLFDFVSLDLLEELERGRRRFSELGGAARNPKTRSQKLKQLLELGLASKEGASYALTERGQDTVAHLKALRSLLGAPFHLKNVERLPHRDYASLLESYCRLLHARFSERLRSIVLFGSVAQGHWDKGSDMDVLVVVDGWEGKAWQRIIELQDVKEQLQKSPEFARAIERGFSAAIQHYPLSTEEAAQFHRIYLDMCLDGIILYDKDAFMATLLSDVRQSLAEQGARRIQLPTGGHYWALKPEAA